MSVRSALSRSTFFCAFFFFLTSTSLIVSVFSAEKAVAKTPFRIELGGGYDITPGDTALVTITKTAGSEEIHGYDLLIGFDRNLLTYIQTIPGILYNIPGDYEWEYFSSRFGSPDPGDSVSPSGLIRSVSLADIANGGHHPLGKNIPDGTVLFTLKFVVPDDTSRCLNRIPIRFIWHDCGDNAIVFPEDGYERLALSDTVIDLQGMIITDTTHSFPTFYGSPSVCIDPGAPNPNRRFNTFVNGGAGMHCGHIPWPFPGDLNLDGLGSTIADYIIFMHYLTQGMDSLTIDPAAQTLASDAKVDYIYLTVDDYVYLTKIIAGILPDFWVAGAPPMCTEKFSGLLALEKTDSSWVIRTNFYDSASALQLVFYAPGRTLDDFHFRAASGIDSARIIIGLNDDSLRILVSDMFISAHTAIIKKGNNDLMELVCDAQEPIFARAAAAGFWSQHVNLTAVTVPNSPPIFDNPPTQLVNRKFDGFSYQFAAHDPDIPPDEIRFHIIYGPGEIDSLTGLWTFFPLCYDSGSILTLELCVSDALYPCPQADARLHAVVQIKIDSLPPLVGDANHDLIRNIKDITYIINFLYNNGPAPVPVFEIADTNGDYLVNVKDITRLIQFLYFAGPAPTCPGSYGTLGYLNGEKKPPK